MKVIELRELAETVTRGVEEIDAELYCGMSHLFGIAIETYREQAGNLFIAAKAQAKEASLPQVMAQLLAYSEEAHRRISELAESAEG